MTPSLGLQSRYALRSSALDLLRDRLARGLRMNGMERLYVADSGICWLCSRPVQWGLPPNDPMRASRDHVVAKHLGGLGTRDNLRLAHQRCNGDRHGVRGVEVTT